MNTNTLIKEIKGLNPREWQYLAEKFENTHWHGNNCQDCKEWLPLCPQRPEKPTEKSPYIEKMILWIKEEIKSEDFIEKIKSATACIAWVDNQEGD